MVPFVMTVQEAVQRVAGRAHSMEGSKVGYADDPPSKCHLN